MCLKPSLLVMGLITKDEDFTAEPLVLGPTSEIYLVSTKRRGIVCVKSTLPKAAGRGQAQAAWMKLVGGIDPDWVPMVFGEDKVRQVFAMEYLPPQTHPLWQSELAAGRADSGFAAKLGERLARVHAETAGRQDMARDFDRPAQFHTAQIEPRFIALAARYGEVAQSLRALARNLSAARIALMHGDLNPASILCGPDGPVFLGARTCSYGDPAFDLACALAALLRHAARQPDLASSFSAAWDALKAGYFARAAWENHGGLERRTAGLVAVLLLGLAVEDHNASQAEVLRVTALSLVREGVSRLDDIRERWTEALFTRQI